MLPLSTSTPEGPMPKPAPVPGHSSPPIGILIRGIQNGHIEDFEILMEHLQTRVIRVCLFLLRHREDARDASQEVFLRLYRHIQKIDSERPLWPWLYRVVVNTCRTLAARRNRRNRLRKFLRFHPPDPPNRNPAEDFAALQDERRILREGLLTLTETERAAVVLRDIEGLSTAETAAVLGSSETTVRSHISRARMKLRAYRRRYLGRSI